MAEKIRITKYSELLEVQEELRKEIRSVVLYGTSEMWASTPRFVPYRGQVIVWTDRGSGLRPDAMGIKIGDGTTYNIDLPFVGDDVVETIVGIISAHVGNNEAHVSADDRRRWNHKVTVADSVSGGVLEITRN